MRVSVVEDGRRLAESLREGLTAEGYAVDVGHNGRRPCTNGNATPILMLTAKDTEISSTGKEFAFGAQPSRTVRGVGCRPVVSGA